MPHSLKIAAPFLALMLGACASQQAAVPTGAPIEITPQTNAALTQYLRVVKVTRPSAFAVSPDGRNSFYTWCDDTACATSTYSTPALRGCQSLSGTPCLILHVRNEFRLAYTRIDNDLPGRHGSEQQRRIEYDVRDR